MKSMRKQPVWQRLAAVADHHLQVGIAIEDAAGQQPQHVEAHLDAEAEHRAVEPRVDHRADHRVGRRLRMDVERLAGIGERAEDRVILRLVEIMALGVAVDHHPVEAQLVRAAADLLRRPVRVLRRDRGHAVKTVRIAFARLLELIVGARRDALGLVGIEERLARPARSATGSPCRCRSRPCRRCGPRPGRAGGPMIRVARSDVLVA